MSVELYTMSESLPERQGVSVGLYAVSESERQGVSLSLGEAGGECRNFTLCLSLSRRGRG